MYLASYRSYQQYEPPGHRHFYPYHQLRSLPYVRQDGMADLSYVENDHCTFIQASCCTRKIADNLDRLVQGFTLGGLNMFYGAVLQMRVYATSPCGNFATCKFDLVPFYPYRP